MRYRTYVGIDAHSQKHCICAIVPETGSLVEHTVMGSAVDAAGWIGGNVDSGILESPLQCVYEAGPTGFSLHRAIEGRGVDCVVAAPSKLPRRTDRMKNDRVDARWLAQMLVSGPVRCVSVPSTSRQALLEPSGLGISAVRDLVRARQRAGALMPKSSTSHAKTRRRHGRTLCRWASALKLDDDAQPCVFKELAAEAQRRRLR